MFLGLWSWWNRRRALGPGASSRSSLPQRPFLLLGYAGAAFAGYAIWCEVLRDVDPGIGDGWRVPIGNDYYFCMIDVPEDGMLLKGGCAGAPIVYGINEIAAAGNLVVGSSESSGPFALNMRTGELETFANVDAALARITPRPTLETANQFYTLGRWGRADAIAAVLILLPTLPVAPSGTCCSSARDPSAAAPLRLRPDVRAADGPASTDGSPLDNLVHVCYLPLA